MTTKTKTLDLFTLSDGDLSRLLRAAKTESARRTRKAVKGQDAGTIIRGHEYAKRAIVVAATGGHSIAFVGGPFGKTLLRALAYELGVTESYELWPCPCGYLRDTAQPCECNEMKINKHRKKNTVTADIWVEIARVPEYEMASEWTGTSLRDMQAKIQSASEPPECPKALDDEAKSILKIAVTELGIDPAERTSILNVAQTIGRLDTLQSLFIRPAYLTEAIMYRRLKGW